MDSDYFSERYGEDFLSLPKWEIESGKVFYFSIYCQFKCSYEFTALLEKEVIIEAGETQVFSLKEGKSQIIKFEHNEKSKKEIQFISYSNKLSSFKMFVSKDEDPSSQNSLLVVPSWIGGYYASLTNKSIDWCENCTFYILLEAETGVSDISFMVKYEDTINKIKHIEPIFSTIKPFQKHCYSIEIEEKSKNENLIIETILFSGSATLGMNPWTNPILSSNQINYVYLYYITISLTIKYTTSCRNIGNGFE